MGLDPFPLKQMILDLNSILENFIHMSLEYCSKRIEKYKFSMFATEIITHTHFKKFSYLIEPYISKYI
jgi:hypothetical protein